MAFTIRTDIADYKDFLDTLRQFTQKAFKAGSVTAGTNTGDGTIYGASASENSVAETWTITCTTGGTNDVAIFSVSGSVSGAQASATAGQPYSVDLVSFCIVSADTDFVSGDSFAFSVASSTAEWVQDSWDTDFDDDGGYQLFQHGIGNSADEIYVGFETKTDDSTYWNIEASALTGYVAGSDLEDQLGYMPEWVCGNDTTFAAYIAFDSYRISYTLIPIEGAHELGGVGWINSYASPSQWSMPNFSGGSHSSASATAGSTGNHYLTGSNLSILWGGSILTTLSVSPKDYGYFSAWHSPLDEKMRLYPATAISEANTMLLGELPSVYWITPYVGGGGLLTALSLIIGEIDDYSGSTKTVCGVTFRNVTYSAAGNISVFDLTGD